MANNISPMIYCKNYFRSSFIYLGAIKVFDWNDDHNATQWENGCLMFKWVFFLIGGSWGNLKCLGRMIRSLYNKNQDPELDCCVGELYRMSMVCFLRTTLTPPGRSSVSPFLKDNCTSDFPNWAFNLKGKNPLFRLRKLVSYKYNASFHFNLLYSDIILRLGISSWT